MTTTHTFDIAIVGGGPVGLFGAYYAGLRNMSCLIIESLPVLGGRLVSIFPEKHVYDVPGFPKILARDLARNLVEQALQFGATVALEETVNRLQRLPSGGPEGAPLWVLDTDKVQRLARSVLIAGGIGHFSPQKHTAPGAAIFEGKGLSYAVLDKAIYAGRNVVVAGGGDSAVDWATELLSVARSVTLVHRTARFRAHERNLTHFRERGGVVLTDTEIVEFGGGEALEWVRLRHKPPAAAETRLDVGAALVLFGYRSQLPDFSKWGIRVSGLDGEVAVNGRMETSLEGVFAAGDVVQYDSKLRLMATGFSEAAMAVNVAKRFLVPSEDVQPLHSTQIMEGR